MTDNVFKDISYAEWLESALRELIDFPVKGVCLIATTPTGEVYTNYHKIGMMDKLKIAGLINQDAMIETLQANNMINEETEDDEDDGEEEI